MTDQCKKQTQHRPGVPPGHVPPESPVTINGIRNIRAVAEEMNEEALTEKNCTASIPMEIASALQMPHRFCDPNRTERTKLEIRQENEIRIQAWLLSTTLSDSELAARVKESYAMRERYWLEQLRTLNAWPVLFICGADHVASFCELLKQQSIAAHVAAEDWASNTTVERDCRYAASCWRASAQPAG